jgi:hypothetical protein
MKKEKRIARLSLIHPEKERRVAAWVGAGGVFSGIFSWVYPLKQANGTFFRTLHFLVFRTKH